MRSGPRTGETVLQWPTKSSRTASLRNFEDSKISHKRRSYANHARRERSVGCSWWYKARTVTAAQIKKKDKDNAIATKIVKPGVNGDLYINVIGERDPHRYWETPRRVCSQAGQGVVYSILKELLNYPRVAKSLGYEKKATAIFAEVKHLIQRLQGAVTEHRTIWDSITPDVALDSLHYDFEMTTAPLLHSGDKDLKEIQLICYKHLPKQQT